MGRAGPRATPPPVPQPDAGRPALLLTVRTNVREVSKGGALHPVSALMCAGVLSGEDLRGSKEICQERGVFSVQAKDFGPKLLPDATPNGVEWIE